ncbi:MHFG family PEP-CTERM protein [Aquabacterium sp. J223]|uniref:MHFG family PEP-CTERM protein n=1 Tax=Aquabacterium sp. J223 TaxID=2898431 RepID=UPI0021AD9CF1|nr:MHFG family PEP-CTERM protein [Aquabacterium sp. J223]UUX95132.1 MHFG family PEP-CTERM protein [Aquabacterium sp. J223]
MPLPLFCLRLSMVLPLALGLAHVAAARGPVLPSCSWDRPGHAAFHGDVVAAVDDYPDIAPEVRRRLQARMALRAYDDLVSIRRDRIEGRRRYDPAIRDMHFGAGRVCREVGRTRWTDTMEERGLVYCDSGVCILVPTVCRNVSRIDIAPGAGPEEPLAFAPPGAGLPPEEGRRGPLGLPGRGDPPVDPWEPLDFNPAAGPALPLPADRAGAPGLAPPLFAPFPLGGAGVPVPVPFAALPPAAGPGPPPEGWLTPAPSNVAPDAVAGLPPALLLPAPLPPVPEPGTWALLLGGGLAVALAARRRRG